MKFNTFLLFLTAISFSLPVSAETRRCLDKDGNAVECASTCAGDTRTVGQQEAEDTRPGIVGKWVIQSLTHHAKDNVQRDYQFKDIPPNSIFTEYFADGRYVTTADLQGRHIIVHGQYQLNTHRAIRLVPTRILRDGTEHPESTGIAVSGECDMFDETLVVTLPKMLSKDVQMAGLTTEYVYSRFKE